jgi:hypothetical protein
MRRAGTLDPIRPVSPALAAVGLVGQGYQAESNRPELFPAGALARGERVIYATRPSFLTLYWGRTLILGLWLLIVVGAGAAPGSLTNYWNNPAAYFFIGLGVFLLYFVYQQWNHDLYALTSRRVVRIKGWRGRDVLSVPIQYVDTVSSTGSSSEVLEFRYRVAVKPSKSDPAGYKIKVLRWPGIPDLLAVSALVQQGIASARDQMRADAMRAQAVQRVAANTVKCEYCGRTVPIEGLDLAQPVCPGCGAPLSLVALDQASG